MPPELRTVAASQGGLFTRRQAAGLGCSEREIKTRTGPVGDWAIVRRGVYAERHVWDHLDDDGRYLLRTRAASTGSKTAWWPPTPPCASAPGTAT